MSLDLSKLEKLVHLADGAKRARCPACAQTGNDRKGEHLLVHPDGKFGCCVFPGDRVHRKLIFALAGSQSPTAIRVRVKVPKSNDTGEKDILGQLGRVFASSEAKTEIREKSGERRETQPISKTVRTPRTPQLLLTRKGNTVNGSESENEAIEEFNEGVRSVRKTETSKDLIKETGGVVGNKQHCPFLLADGTLVIPFDSPEKFHWWKGGQLVSETRAESLRTVNGRNQRSTSNM